MVICNIGAGMRRTLWTEISVTAPVSLKDGAKEGCAGTRVEALIWAQRDLRRGRPWVRQSWRQPPGGKATFIKLSSQAGVKCGPTDRHTWVVPVHKSEVHFTSLGGLKELLSNLKVTMGKNDYNASLDYTSELILSLHTAYIS